MVTPGIYTHHENFDEAALVIDSLTLPAHGTAAIDGDQVIYTPADNYYGSDSFTRHVSG